MKLRIFLFLLFSFSMVTLFAKVEVPQIQQVKIGVKADNKGPKRLKVEANVLKLLTTLNESYKKSTSEIQLTETNITTDGLDKLNLIWEQTKFYCTQPSINQLLLHNSQGYQIRNIEVQTEDNEAYSIVLEIDDSGLVADIFFAIAQHQYNAIMESKGTVDITHREIILNFIEMFRTAYVRKDISYLNTVFSDDALFITGKMVRKAEIENVSGSFNKEHVVQIEENKKEYMKRLKTEFNAAKSIQLKFDSIVVLRHKKHPNFYGVQLEQHWASAADKNHGVLFLLIQFREDLEPLIWVRGWQDIQIPADQRIGFHWLKID